MAPRPLKNERGVALLMVVVAIAVLTAVAVEFTYNSRVDLELAANQRDDLRAYYLARSGLGLARLVLHFQKQVDSIQIPNLAGLLGGGAGGGLAGLLGGSSAASTTGATGAAGATGSTAAAGGGSMNIQLWKMAHVDCHMLEGMIPPQGANGDGLGSLRAKSRDGAKSRVAPPPTAAVGPDGVTPPTKPMAYGAFDGCFNAKIEDEEERLNVNQLNAPALTATAAATRMLGLFGDKRFEFLFSHPDANKVKVTPQETMMAMRDWIDEDDTQAAINLSAAGVDAISNGFSDEAAPYDHYTPHYRPKNAPMDSVDELYLVHGVSDAFMQAFRDRLTVFPDINTALNINTDDPVLIYMAILSVSDPVRPDGRLKDPLFVDELIKRIRGARMFSFFGMSVSDFVNIVQSSGIAINTSIVNSRQSNRWVSDKTSTFRVTVTGEVGHVTRTITTVIRTDNQQDQLGRLVYWREE